MSLKTKIMDSFPEFKDVKVIKDVDERGRNSMKVLASTRHSVTNVLYTHTMLFSNDLKLSEEHIVKLIESMVKDWENNV